MRKYSPYNQGFTELGLATNQKVTSSELLQGRNGTFVVVEFRESVCPLADRGAGWLAARPVHLSEVLYQIFPRYESDVHKLVVDNASSAPRMSRTRNDPLGALPLRKGAFVPHRPCTILRCFGVTSCTLAH